jgi:hypothetical protein
MSSIRLRREIVPLNSIVIQSNTEKPTGYTNETSLYGKFIRGTPTSATEPGGSEGNATHTHSSVGDHTHTISDSTAHTHTVTSGEANTTNQTDRRGGSGHNIPEDDHTHLVTSSSSSPSVSAATEGAHTHDALANDPNHKTQFFLKHTETSIGLRRKTLGMNSIFMWGKATSALPSRYAVDTNFDDKHIKGVANGGSTPNEDLGSNTHQHASQAGHKHDVTLAAHTHTWASEANGDTTVDTNGTFTSTATTTHGHTTNTFLFDSNSGVLASTNDTSHQHSSLNHEPEYKTLYFIKQTSIGLRASGIPVGGMLLWLGAVADIPTNWQVGDGTSGTFDMRNKYPKGEDASSPGTTGGSNTHQHNSQGGAHTHTTGSLAHTHTTSGSSSDENANQNTSLSSPTQSNQEDHNHPGGNTSSSDGNSTTLNSTSDAHQHDSLNSQPPTILVSIIERLTP